MSQSREARRLQTSLVRTIDQNDREFFDSFEAALVSGDHVVIDAAIIEAAETLLTTAEENYGLSLSESGPVPDACSIGIVVCVWTVAGVYNWGVAVNVGFVVLAWVQLVEPESASLEGQLLYDELVHDLATR